MVTMWYTVFFSAAISEFCAICEYGIQLRDEGERIGVYEQQERGGAIIYRYVGVSINPDVHIFSDLRMAILIIVTLLERNKSKIRRRKNPEGMSIGVSINPDVHFSDHQDPVDVPQWQV